MKYKSVVLTKRGGPEVLQIREQTLRPLKEKEVLLKVLACGVGRTDVTMRYKYYPFAPKIPFVPGYEVVGTVSAIGDKVNRINLKDTVAALTVYGGYSEYIILDEDDLVTVPQGIAPDVVASTILNYSTAYQILKRILKVKKDKSVLITGASGGMGTALIDLCKLVGMKIYGLSSTKKHEKLISMAITPIDYQHKNWIGKLKELEPNGVDYVIDGLGGKYIQYGYSILKSGGSFVEYGYPSFKGMIAGLVKIKLLNLIHNRKNGTFYGISADYRKNRSLIQKDLSKLFDMIKDGHINPIIHHRFPVLDAKLANEILEKGDVIGKIVLVKDKKH